MDKEISIELTKLTTTDKYSFLSRFISDCKYFLGAGNGSTRQLYYSSVNDQISAINFLYSTLQKKPEWITPEEIQDLETKMINFKK